MLRIQTNLMKMPLPSLLLLLSQSLLLSRKLDFEESVTKLKTELAKAAIAPGTNGNKVRESTLKAAAFAKEMMEKEATIKELEGYEKKLEEEYKVLQM